MTVADGKYVWLDCGHDDALAILLCAFHPEIHLLGISTVHGNQELHKTTQNALNVLHALNRLDIPVYQGTDTPLVNEPLICSEIHGDSGLDGWDFEKSPINANLENAIHAMKREIDNAPQPVTVIATGCQTNIALLVKMYPELLKERRIEKIVVMGGAVGLGNTNPAAEFNIQVDPHAATTVLRNCTRYDCELWYCPLEVTHTAILTEEVSKRLLNRASTVPDYMNMLKGLLGFFAETYKNMFMFNSGPPVHDPCAVLLAIRPEKFPEVSKCFLHVETEGFSAGRTNFDVTNWLRKPANCVVALKMEVDFFWSEMEKVVEMAAKHIESTRK